MCQCHIQVLEKLYLPQIEDIIKAIKKVNYIKKLCLQKVLMPALSPTMTEGIINSG